MKKKVRRIRQPWLHDDIVGMKRSLEKMDLPRRSAMEKPSHPYCVCIPSSVKTDNQPIPHGLPSNYYNPEILKNMSDIEKAMLEAGPERPIPELVCIHTCPINFHSCYFSIRAQIRNGKGNSLLSKTARCASLWLPVVLCTTSLWTRCNLFSPIVTKYTHCK